MRLEASLADLRLEIRLSGFGRTLSRAGLIDSIYQPSEKGSQLNLVTRLSPCVPDVLVAQAKQKHMPVAVKDGLEYGYVEGDVNRSQPRSYSKSQSSYLQMEDQHEKLVKNFTLLR